MSPAPLRKHSDVLAEYLPPAGKRILDVGCGEGALVRHFAKRGAEAVGVDPLAQAIARAEAAEPVAGASYRLGGGERLPFADASFDAVCFFNSLHHIPGPQMAGALAEALRVVKPGGLIYVLEPIAAGDYFELMRPVEDETEVRAEALAALRDFAARPEVATLEELHYDAPARYDSFEHWESHVLSVDPARADRLAAARERIRPHFEATAEREPSGGYLYRQHARLNLYAKKV